MKQSKANKAVETFQEGFNCSQSVFTTYCEEFGIDRKSALGIACGLGAGMGRRQETCGAVSGAYLLLGLKYGQIKPDDAAAKEKTYAMVQEFARLFEERNGATSCRELLGIDFRTADSSTTARIKSICPKIIQDAAEIVEQLLYSEEVQP